MIPERPLDILRRGRQRGEHRIALTSKRRPVLIVQNDRDNANPRYQYLMVAPVHSLRPGELARIQEADYPADLVLVPPEEGLTRPSVAFLNQLRTLNKNLLLEQIGTLPDKRMAELDVRLALSLGLIEPQK